MWIIVSWNLAYYRLGGNMREIKFRAWDKINEVLNPVWVIDFQYRRLQMYADTPEESGDGAWTSFDDVELMQFTGLHDKSGKEIYEGDRMQIQQGYYKALRNRDIELEVVFNYGSFVLKNDKFETPIDTTGEIIGNIYEKGAYKKGYDKGFEEGWNRGFTEGRVKW